MCWRESVPVRDPEEPTRAPSAVQHRAAELARVLAQLHVHGVIEVVDHVAVIATAPEMADRLADPGVRAAVVATARASGFSHVAVALGEP